MRKKYALLVSLLIVCMAVSACGSKKNTTTQNQSQSAQVTERPKATVKATTAKAITPAESFAGGDGTEANPFQIGTKEELALLAKYVNENTNCETKGILKYSQASYVLTSDIQINDPADKASWLEKEPEYLWTVIGAKYRFEGVFEGAGHIISGLYYYGDGDKDVYVGLFGDAAKKATIRNLTVKDSLIYVINCTYSTSVGAIAGQVWGQSAEPWEEVGAVIDNCHNVNTDIYGDGHRIGGIVGAANGNLSISNCTNSGNMTNVNDGKEPVGDIGGIVGEFLAYNIDNCVNTGTITGAESAGGIIGGTLFSAWYDNGVMKLDGTPMEHSEKEMNSEHYMSNLTNKGTVTSTGGATGGVIGGFSNSAARVFMENFVNEGDVVSTAKMFYCGGIIGEAYTKSWGKSVGTSILSKAENKADLENVGSSALGGLIGYINVSEGESMFIDYSTNSGNISGGPDGNMIGGCVASAIVFKGGTLQLESCTNNGEVSIGEQNSGSIGGIVSLYSNSAYKDKDTHFTVENCVNNGNIVGRSLVVVSGGAGIVGYIRALSTPGDTITVKGCTNNGDIRYALVNNEMVVENHGGIVGMVSATSECDFKVADNVNNGDIILVADSFSKDEIADAISRHFNAAIAGGYTEDTQFISNTIGGKLKITGIDFETSLEEKQATYNSRDMADIEKAAEQNK